MGFFYLVYGLVVGGNCAYVSFLKILVLSCLAFNESIISGTDSHRLRVSDFVGSTKGRTTLRLRSSFLNGFEHFFLSDIDT